MKIVNYQNIFDELNVATRSSSIDEIAVSSDFIGTSTEYSELRTIRMSGVRQSGKTTWLIEKLKSDLVCVGLTRDSHTRSHAVSKGAPEAQLFGSLTNLMSYIRESPKSIDCIVIDDASTVHQQRMYYNLCTFLAEMNLQVKPIIVCLG